MHDAHKWIPMTVSHSSKSNSHKMPQVMSLLDIEMESPPLVFYGSTTTSSGALLSGQLVLRILSETAVVNSLNMSLDLEITRKRPFHANCLDCRKKRAYLESWKFLHASSKFQKGEHKFPFSWILPGHLPATTKGSLFDFEYILYASLVLKEAEPITLSKVLEVKRAIIPSDLPRNYVRVFPPTNITAYCSLPSVLHPFGTSNIFIRVDGCIREDPVSKIKHQWKLKRLHLHLDETQKSISPGCRRHVSKRSAKDEENKGLTHTDVRVIGEDCYRMGWKTENSKYTGRIEMEFPFAIRSGARAICDMKAPDGTEVSHTLVVEMIVTEEYMPNTPMSTVSLPTGAARVLRMHFNIVVTERPGLGISWDEEQPPLYENIPASPPEYGNSISLSQDSISDYENSLSINEHRAIPETSLGVQHLMSMSSGRQIVTLS